VVAEAAFDALMKLERQIAAGTTERKIQSIHYVNLDAEATAAFIEAFSNQRMSGKAEGDGEFSPDGAAVVVIPESKPEHVKSSSVARVVGKRERRLKVSNASEVESAAVYDASSKKQKISAGDDTEGE